MKLIRNMVFYITAIFMVFAIFNACDFRKGAQQPVGNLRVGDPAPMLRIDTWIKGNPVERFEPGRFYVVEFWATWCPPCREAIPHMTELAHAHSDRVTFIGVNVWERSVFGSVKSKVEGFVKEMGPRMDYVVGLDSADEYMANHWLRAAGRNGIPAAMVVDGEGKIAWIGHPMGGLKEYLQGATGAR